MDGVRKKTPSNIHTAGVTRGTYVRIYRQYVLAYVRTYIGYEYYIMLHHGKKNADSM